MYYKYMQNLASSTMIKTDSSMRDRDKEEGEFLLLLSE